MTPTMSESSKIRELKERAIYKLTLRYGRPFVVFLNTPRLAGAIGSLPENGNKQIPASVQQLTRAIRSDSVSLEAITRYAKYADNLQGMLMDSDKLDSLLRAGEGDGSGSGGGLGGLLSSAVSYVRGSSGSGDPNATLEQLRAEIQQLQNDLRECQSGDTARKLQQAIQDLQRCNETVTSLSQEIQDLNKQLREQRSKNARLISRLSVEAQAEEREKERQEDMRRAAEEQQRRLEAERRADAAVTTRVRDRLAAERQDTTRLEAGRRSADARGRKRSIGVIPRGAPQGTRTVFGDDEETKVDECGALPAGFVSAPTVEKKVTTKEVLEFAQATGFDKNKILVYSNRRNLVGFAFYCPILGVKIDGRNSTVDIDKKGQKVTLKTGRNADDSVIMSDFYVNKEAFAAFLASARGTGTVRAAPAAPSAPATPPEPTRTPTRTPASNTRTRIRFDDDGSATTTRESVTDPFAGIQRQTPVAQTAPAQAETQKGCEYGSVASAPLGLLGATTLDANADIEVIFEYASRVGLKKEKILYRSKADDGSTFNVYSGSAYCPIEQWDRVGNDMVLSSRTIATADIVVANFYVSAEDFWVPLTKAADAKKGYLFRDSNGAIVGIIEGPKKGGFVGIEGQTGKRATGAYQRKPSEAEAQTYQSAAPARAAAPADTTPAVRRSTRSATRATPSSSTPSSSTPAATTRAAAPARSTPAPAPARQSSTSGIASGLDYKGWNTATAGTYVAAKYGGGKKGKKAASKAKSAAWEKYKKSQGRSLMDRIEDFEGVDGVVPALPSIRIPERHEM